MKKLKNIEIIKKLYLNLDFREKILFERFYHEQIEKELEERTKVRKEIAGELVKMGMDKGYVEKTMTGEPSYLHVIYGPDVQDTTCYPVPVTYKGEEVGKMDKNGAVTFKAGFNVDNLFKDQIISASSRALGQISINGKLQEVRGIESSIMPNENHIEFDFKTDEVVILPFDEIGVIDDIDTKLLWGFPYKVRILHGVMNSVGEVLEFRKDQLKKCNITKVLL